MDSKVVIGLLVIIALLFGGVFLVRNNPQLITRFTGQDSDAISPTPESTDSAELAADNATLAEVDGGETQGISDDGSMPATGSYGSLANCTPELIEADCSSAARESVCGYETVIDSRGNETNRELDYISACHLCKLHANGRLRMGDEMVVLLGYRNGTCSQ